MEIKITWTTPVQLKWSSNDATYSYAKRNPRGFTGPGIYMFVRQHGEKIVPLYIGRTAKALNKRLEQHLNTVRFVTNLRNATNGTLRFIYGTVTPKQGMQIDRVLKMVERALIQEALVENHELFNQQGTKRPVHTVSFTGNQTAKRAIKRRAITISQKPNQA